MGESRLEKISFIDDNDETVELYVIEETTLRGVKYLLVAEDDSDESEAYIFREISESDAEITYIPVEDDDEYEALIKVFTELLEDAKIISGS
ncbi:MAG: DUF1292 domain-containing protein [Lachnospiraceae bacterium]|nr:DUF1292 domain-containing protein [Lachnospiraceae bacterium]